MTAALAVVFSVFGILVWLLPYLPSIPLTFPEAASRHSKRYTAGISHETATGNVPRAN
jgi:hypothetical protein